MAERDDPRRSWGFDDEELDRLPFEGIRFVITLVDINGGRHELPVPPPASRGVVAWSKMPDLPLSCVELEARETD